MTGALISIVRLAALLALLSVMAGCGSVPTEHFYTLTAMASVERAAAVNSIPDAGITIDAATVPDLVDRPQLVISIGENRVAILEQQRWAEPLRAQISRTVAMNLSRLLGASRVSAYPQTTDSDAGYRVTLDIQRFESRPGDAVQVEALWTVRGATGAESKSGRSAVRETIGSEGYDALVAAHSRAVAAISRDIAAALQALAIPRR